MAMRSTLMHDAETLDSPESRENAARIDSGRPLRESLLAFCAVAFATWTIDALARQPVLAGYEHLALAALFLVSAVALAQRAPGGLNAHGLQLGGLLDPPTETPNGLWQSALDLAKAVGRALPSALRETLVATAVAAMVFPMFALVFRLWHAPSHDFLWNPPPNAMDIALTQVLVIAIPEEAFFRGYLQTRLSAAFSRRVRWAGVALSAPAWLLQAALFAVLHFLVDPQPARLAVFFPALAFGGLRQWRGGIGAAAVFHAQCNLLSEFLTRGYLS